MKSPVQIFDALGLGLFAISGAGKVIAFHLGPGAAVLMGVLTGIRVSMARDVLASEVPVVFTAELYAVAALAGAAVVVGGDIFFPRSTPTAALGGLFCVVLRSWPSGTAGSFRWLSSRIDSRRGPVHFWLCGGLGTHDYPRAC